MTYRTIICAILIFPVCCAVLAQNEENALPTGILLIVNSANPASDITLKELHEYLMGEKQFWNQGAPVQICFLAMGSRENQIVLAKATDNDEAAYQKHWQNKRYRGEALHPPLHVDNKTFLLRFVKERSGALGVYPAGEVPYGVKVLTVEGKSWGDPGYPLAE